MNATDLMIGDWVDVYHELPDESGFYKPLQVTGIHHNDGICFGHSVIESPWIEPEEFEAVKPIPLTPEILEKNGFVKFPHKDEDNFRFNYSEYYEIKGEFDLNIENGIRKGSTCGEIYEYVFTAIHYVHELQHALRLCGIKKEVVL